MKRFVLFAATAVVTFVVVPFAVAADPPVVPFPSAQAGEVFIAAQTVTTSGAVSNFFAPGGTVVFRAYAVDGKTKKLLTKKTTKYFYVKIPNHKNVTLKYLPKTAGTSGRYAWIGRWTVPADYTLGIVNFKVVVRTKTKRFGSFAQMPVATSQLTITATPQAPPGNAPATPAPTGSSKVTLGLYVDAVNGTRPAGTAPRPIGCTQTNVFKRGEQLVVRAWGYDLATGAILSMDNVVDAHFTVPGQANVTLNWGSHGATGNKVWFWTNQWQIPKDYPLGDASIRVSFKTDTGKTGTFDYQITINP
jgi:hypothetical protein